MSLTRKALQAMGIESDKIDQIMEMHTEVADRINGELDTAKADAKKYKADADRLAEVEKELNDLKAKESQPDAYKEKYEKIKKEYDTYKGEVTAKETKAAKTKAYRDMLKDIKVSEDWIDDIVKFTDLDSIELEDDGKIKNVAELTKSTKEKYAKYIFSESTQGAKTPTPPNNTGGGSTMTKQQIMDIKDPVARHKAMAENMEMFGIGKE